MQCGWECEASRGSHISLQLIFMLTLENMLWQAGICTLDNGGRERAFKEVSPIKSGKTFT